MTPKTGDTIVLYGESMLIRRMTDRGHGPVVVTEDARGWLIERRVDSLEWVESLNAWRPIADRPADVTAWKLDNEMGVSVPLSYMEEE
jgi:hypothetical protein